jgi:anti-sigma regulatory factor (Ser/Thr protein kinase)
VTVRFEVPARADYVGLLRMVMAALAGGRRQLDEEQLDDLRLALSEACNLLMPGAEGRVAVVWDEEPESVVIELRHAGGVDVAVALEGPVAIGPAGDTVLPLALLRALVDDVAVSDEGGLRLTLRCTAR